MLHMLFSALSCYDPGTALLTWHLLPAFSTLPCFWLWQFLGRLHPLIVHFPIGLLFVGLILELFTLKKKHSELRSGIHIVLVVGATTALLAGILGWLLQEQDQYSGNILTFHKWSGVTTALLATITVLLHRRISQKHHMHLISTYRSVL